MCSQSRVIIHTVSGNICIFDFEVNCPLKTKLYSLISDMVCFSLSMCQPPPQPLWYRAMQLRQRSQCSEDLWVTQEVTTLTDKKSWQRSRSHHITMRQGGVSFWQTLLSKILSVLSSVWNLDTITCIMWDFDVQLADFVTVKSVLVFLLYSEGF